MGDPQLTGVGLTLLPSRPGGVLRIANMDPEGAAARTGYVHIGDMLYEVDDKSAVGLNGQQLKNMILGQPGTQVTLGLRRQNGPVFYVRVIRAQPKQRPAPAGPARQPQPQQPVQRAAPPPPPQRQIPQDTRRARAADNDDPDDPPVGIGIGLAQDSTGNLCISSLMPGSPALRSGLVEEGDTLQTVDGVDVRGMTPEQVRPLIMGKAGSFVTVSVQRGNTQIVARMARARPSDVSKFAPPRAGVSTVPKPDTNTFASAYSQVTADKRSAPGGPGGQGGSPNTLPATQPYLKAPSAGPEAAPKQDQELCGVGIVLAQNSFQELVVLSMNEGGPAARSNLIKKHDVLQTIDGKDVYKQTIDQIRPLILGLPGSTLQLGFQRPGMRSNRPVNVRLRRGTVKPDLRNIPNPSPRPSPSQTPLNGPTPRQSPRQTPTGTPGSTRPSSPGPMRAPPGYVRSAPPPPQNEENKYGPDGPVCGLGVVLVPTAYGTLNVASITSGGPAERCGRIVRGDEVETIDGVNVRGKTINDVRPLILGPAGTYVTLGLRRESEDSVVYVRVMREPVRLGEVLVPGMRVKQDEPLPAAPSPPRAQAHPQPQPSRNAPPSSYQPPAPAGTYEPPSADSYSRTNGNRAQPPP
eukprot:CAMPEP_0177705350 /NCGR_PEP_ID=MMETSP0484_2-20121128/8662_1 /TAXON_ID=354590 /ORGANISM="Rhodomonas lens, Strain RHODO" /LENGTH=634 /DNA_ID=CAMNT_0019216773 /DNA_START=191 /DNA_END=2091 /DNA_ORIENTATION=+